MTSAEKKEKAAAELHSIAVNLFSDFKRDLTKTKDFKKSVLNLQNEVHRKIRQDPQRKTVYLRALIQVITSLAGVISDIKTKAEADKALDAESLPKDQ